MDGGLWRLGGMPRLRRGTVPYAAKRQRARGVRIPHAPLTGVVARASTGYSRPPGRSRSGVSAPGRPCRTKLALRLLHTTLMLSHRALIVRHQNRHRDMNVNLIQLWRR